MSRQWAMAVWALLGFGVFVFLIATKLSRGRLPTLGGLVGRITQHRWGQWLLVIVWAWFGWHTFAR
jgi:Family of unknown function (DUF6186)